jgi:hypothetical protein
LQVNLEYLARVVFNSDGVLYPDTLVGTDSHTTMIDGLGVAGWGVGGIEAEAAMLGQVRRASRFVMIRYPDYGLDGGVQQFLVGTFCALQDNWRDYTADENDRLVGLGEADCWSV